MTSKFSPGRMVITRAAQEEIPELTVHQALRRHLQGDWGDLSEEDKQSNEEALKDGGRLFSSYVVNELKFWIITEADRSATTVMLPSDY
jgi:hypothetical protein